MAQKKPTHEDALALVYEYREKDPKVVALAKAYATLLTVQELAHEHWKTLDAAVARLKRAFKSEE